MHLERTRENVFTVTATGQELSTLIGAARMALEVMQHAGGDRPPPEALEQLERVLADFDRSRARMTGTAPAES